MNGIDSARDLPLAQFVLTAANTDKHLKAVETLCFYAHISSLFKTAAGGYVLIIFFKGGDMDTLG